MAFGFDELNTSPTISGSGKDLTMTRTGIVIKDDLDLIHSELFPGAILGISQLPKEAPESFLRAKSYSIKPFHSDARIDSCENGQAKYLEYEVEIQYGLLEQVQGEDGNGDPNAEPVMTIRKSIGGEFMTLPGRKLKWAGGADVQGEDILPGKMIPMIDIQVTLERVPSVPEAAIRSLIGKVNSAAFLGAAVESLLFMGADLSRELTTEGVQPWRVELRFQERQLQWGGSIYGWNHFYDPSDGTWKKIETAAGVNVYPKASFSSLW